jgi:hypothetical protein
MLEEHVKCKEGEIYYVTLEVAKDFYHVDECV